MQTGNSIFYGTVLLTGSNLLLRLILMSFQVFLSGRIGAAGMGLLQLTFSLKELAFTLGSAGIRTCAVYLTAESLGRGRARMPGPCCGAAFDMRWRWDRWRRWGYGILPRCWQRAGWATGLYSRRCGSARCFCRCGVWAVCWMPTAPPWDGSGS